MKRVNFVALSLLASLGFTTGADAAITHYTDRAAFEADLARVSIDDLTGITQGALYTIHRDDYALSGAFYGCDGGGCGLNESIGFDYPGYVWNYYGVDTFVFETAINGFGFDFAIPTALNGTALPTLAGATATAAVGFFGYIDTNLFTTVTLTHDEMMLIDNVTYGALSTTPSVPLPAGLPLLSLALISLAAARRKTGLPAAWRKTGQNRA